MDFSFLANRFLAAVAFVTHDILTTKLDKCEKSVCITFPIQFEEESGILVLAALFFITFVKIPFRGLEFGVYNNSSDTNQSHDCTRSHY